MSADVQRILFLARELSFRGSCLMSLRLARGLERRQYDTALVCSRQGAFDNTLLRSVRLHRIPGYAIPFWNRIVLRTLVRDQQDQPPDVIHVLDRRLLPQANWLAEEMRLPIVLTLFDHSDAAGLIVRSVSRNLRAIISVSESVQAQIKDQPSLTGIEQRVILPGVGLPPEGTAPPPPFSDRNEPVIGMAGRLEAIKGVAFFLKACHRVIEAGYPIRIVVAGSGPEERGLRQLATSLNLTPRMIFVEGGVAMQAYLSAVDVFCLPSLQQGLGVLLLEAMAMGRPVIASGVGGVVRVIEDNQSGLIVPPSDSRRLSERIIELLKDPGRARQIASRGQEVARTQFHEDRMLDETIQLYQEICDRAPGKTTTIPLATNTSS
jgi:glycosyltransferase involved in cell wall biosynthesis